MSYAEAMVIFEAKPQISLFLFILGGPVAGLPTECTKRTVPVVS